MQPENFAPLRVSTDVLPAHERLPFWREVVGRKLVNVDIEPLSDTPVKAEATLLAWPGLQTSSCVSFAARSHRTRERVADGDDTLGMVINRNGTMTGSQRGRDVSLGPGDAAIILHAEPAMVTYSLIHYECLVVPRAALAPLVTDVEGAAMQIIPHGNEALRLLATYLETMREKLALATPELRQLSMTHVYDLLALAIGASRDGAAIAAERGVAAARLATIKADVMARLGRDLDLAAVAARQQVTPRYIQLLFEREGITFSQFVLEQRLARAHHMLTSPRHAEWTISAIALAAGFGDLSHFNRSFRRRYGATPSDVRAAAQRRGDA